MAGTPSINEVLPFMVQLSDAYTRVSTAIDGYTLQPFRDFFASLTEVPYKDWHKQASSLDLVSYILNETISSGSKLLFAATAFYTVTSFTTVAFWVTASLVTSVALNELSRQKESIDSFADITVRTVCEIRDSITALTNYKSKRLSG